MRSISSIFTAFMGVTATVASSKFILLPSIITFVETFALVPCPRKSTTLPAPLSTKPTPAIRLSASCKFV